MGQPAAGLKNQYGYNSIKCTDRANNIQLIHLIFLQMQAILPLVICAPGCEEQRMCQDLKFILFMYIFNILLDIIEQNDHHGLGTAWA